MPTAPDHFETAGAALALLDRGADGWIRFERLRRALQSRGIASSDDRIPEWFAAALCRTAAERERFLAAFVTGGIAISDQETGTRAAERPRPAGATSAIRRLREWLYRHRRLAAAATALLLGALLLWLRWLLRPGPLTTGTLNTTSSPSAIPIAQQQFHPDWGLMALAMVPLIFALLYALFEHFRRRQIRRDFAPPGERSETLGIARIGEAHFGGAASQRVRRLMQRHWAGPSSRLDIARTIRATIRSGGIPQPQMATRPHTPQYLVLSERQSPRDHLAALAQAFSQRLREDNVAHEHFEFFGLPYRLQPAAEGQPPAREQLASVVARSQGARTLVMMEAHDCAAGTAAPPWIAELSGLGRTALLDPRPPRQWGTSEALLAAAGLQPFTADEEGFAAYGTWLTEADRPVDMAVGRGFDPCERLARHRRMMLGEEAPADPLVQGIVYDLGATLGEEAMIWLRAVALSPRLDPGLTVQLGRTLRSPAGVELFSQQRYLALARLPWLRAGRMPRWLRVALVRGLKPAQLDIAVAVIQAYLLPVADAGDALEIDLARGRDAKLREKLLTWLRMTPESVLSDRILIEALQGRHPARLAVEAPNALAHALRWLRLWRELRVALLLASISAFMVAVAIYRPIASPDANGVPDNGIVDNATSENPIGGNVAADNVSAGGDGTGTQVVTDVIGMNATDPSVENLTDPTKPDPKRQDPVVPPVPPDDAQRWVIFFDFDRTSIGVEAATILDSFAQSYFQAVKSKPFMQYTVVIAAYTDRSRTEQYNIGLSGRQAEATKSYLVSRGVPASVIYTTALGESRPAVPTADGVREPQNRRVEIELQGRASPQGSSAVPLN